jgi:hypothetical protein
MTCWNNWSASSGFVMSYPLVTTYGTRSSKSYMSMMGKHHRQEKRQIKNGIKPAGETDKIQSISEMRASIWS